MFPLHRSFPAPLLHVCRQGLEAFAGQSHPRLPGSAAERMEAVAGGSHVQLPIRTAESTGLVLKLRCVRMVRSLSLGLRSANRAAILASAWVIAGCLAG